MLRLYGTQPDTRQRQINTLKIFNDNVSEVQEGTEYNIAFRAGTNEFLLHVLLTEDFPNDKPILKVTPVVVHEWVTQNGEITGAPGLLNFTVHSDLGRVVQAIIREFNRKPPPIVSDQSASANIPVTSGIDNKVAIMGSGSTSSYTGSSNQTFIPTPLTFPELNSLSLDELRFLNDCPERQDEFLENMQLFKDIHNNIDNRMTEIEEMNDSYLDKQERMNVLKDEICSKIEKVTKLTFENERLITLYQTLSEKYSPRNIKDELHKAAEKLNTNCETIVDSFLNSEIDVDKFVSTYIPMRMLSQIRKTKEEKLAQQLHNLEKAGF